MIYRPHLDDYVPLPVALFASTEPGHTLDHLFSPCFSEACPCISWICFGVYTSYVIIWYHMVLYILHVK